MRAALLLALCLALGTTRTAALPRDLAPDEAAEIAAGRRPYLVLDLGTGRLTLWQGGARLRDYEVRRTEIGVPRIGRRPEADGAGGPIGAWAPLRVVPERRRERIELQSEQPVDPDPSATVPWIPPLPEELNPTPRRFVVHYRGGLGLEVVRDSDAPADPGPGSWNRRLSSAALAMPWHHDRLRLRLLVPETEAGALYRSGALEAVLVVVPAP